jgi:hypothetical protein
LRKLVVVNNQVGNVDITVILLDKHVFPDLVSSILVRSSASKTLEVRVPVDEDVVEGKFHDEVHQRLLDAGRCRRILDTIASLAAKKAD